MKLMIHTALMLCLLSPYAVRAQDVPGCGSLQNHYGPFDYRTDRARLKIVEDAHFTPMVETLVRGKSSDFVGEDLSYTLRTSPNHHRALISVSRLVDRSKNDQPHKMQYPLDCYFRRAVTFRPDDTVVRALYAQYLNRNGRTAEGIQHLRAAVNFAADNPLSHYNIGLVSVELKAYELALQQAHTAIAMGMPPGRLVEQLKALGHWKETTPVTPAVTQDPASSASARPAGATEQPR